MKQKFWQRMSLDQLVDSLVLPEDVEEVVFKSKTIRTLKYCSDGKNRYRQRIILENDEVVGWQIR